MQPGGAARPADAVEAARDVAHGWYHLAFADEVGDGISSFAIGSRRLILVRRGDLIRCFDADCPHRGAHLGVSGRLVPGGIACGFHGYRLSLDAPVGPRCRPEQKLRLREHPVLNAGPAVLVRLSGQFDFGLGSVLAELGREHAFVEGLHLARIRTSMRTVVENGFDARHFGGVHRIILEDFTQGTAASGALQARGTFRTPGRPAADGELPVFSSVAYEGTAFSPGLILVRLGGEAPYGVMTGASDNGDGTCDIRLTFVLPKARYGDRPEPDAYAFLTTYSRTGLSDDAAIWESLAPSFSPVLMPEDQPIEAFHAFCAQFG